MAQSRTGGGFAPNQRLNCNFVTFSNLKKVTPESRTGGGFEPFCNFVTSLFLFLIEKKKK